MPAYAYKGRNKRGELVRGTLESADSNSAADQLFNNGITPLDINVARGALQLPRDGWLARFFEPKIKLIDIMLFSRQMYTLLKAGVPILRALAGLQESSDNSSMARVIRDLRENLDSGRELSTAMRRHPETFTSFYVSMVRVGEMTGMLENVFLRLFHYLEFEKTTREQVKAALRYPTIVIATMGIALVVINVFVIPAFAKVYAGFNTELPLLTRGLLAFSNFMVNYWWILIVGVIAAFFAFKGYIARSEGRYKWDRIKLRIPIAGPIIRKATLARFARSFALASRSGIPIVQTFTVVSQVVDNAFIAQRVEQMRDGIERGESVLRTAVTAGVFNPVVLQMVAVGEETGELDDLLQEIAEMYEREVEYEVKNLSAKIEPVLVIGLGIIMLILALGVFLPIWDLSQVALKR